MALIYVDYRPPHLQRLPLHEHRPFKFRERHARDVAAVIELVGGELDDDTPPTHPLDPRAHFIVRVDDAAEAQARREIALWARETYKGEAESINDFLEGLSLGVLYLARALAGTPAGPILGLISEGAEILDDVPEMVAGDLDVLDDMLTRTHALIRRAEAAAERPSAEPTAADMPEGLSARLRALRD